MNQAHNKLLMKNFETAVEDYRKALLSQWELDNHYGYWAGDEIGGVYCYEDTFYISIDNMMLCIENDVTEQQYIEWQDYCVEASNHGFTTPNLKSWLEGCPRVPQETLDRLCKIKQDLSDLVEIEKQKITNKPE